MKGHSQVIKFLLPLPPFFYILPWPLKLSISSLSVVWNSVFFITLRIKKKKKALNWPILNCFSSFLKNNHKFWKIVTIFWKSNVIGSIHFTESHWPSNFSSVVSFYDDNLHSYTLDKPRRWRVSSNLLSLVHFVQLAMTVLAVILAQGCNVPLLPSSLPVHLCSLLGCYWVVLKELG